MLITKAEFARRMKVSPAAVGKAVKSGRLALADGKHLDERVAELQWDLNRQRLPPVIKPSPPPILPPPSTQSDPDLDHDALWITMNWNAPALPALVHTWLIQNATRLEPALLALLSHFAACVRRMNEPEPDDDES